MQPFEIDPGVGPADRRQFVHSETEQAVLGMLDSIDAPWINPRLADDAAHRKPLQWTQAAAVGLTLPPTCVTTAPDEAPATMASFLANSRQPTTVSSSEIRLTRSGTRPSASGGTTPAPKPVSSRSHRSPPNSTLPSASWLAS